MGPVSGVGSVNHSVPRSTGVRSWFPLGLISPLMYAGTSDWTRRSLRLHLLSLRRLSVRHG